MDAFLIDTTVLSIYLDPSHPHHVTKRQLLATLPAENPRFVSPIALGELEFGTRLASLIGKGDPTRLNAILAEARAYAILDITHHTAFAYAELKSKVAHKYLAKTLRQDRPKYVEEWIDKATGQKLAIDENDLWMCAQAKERELVLVTADARMKRIPDADAEVRLLIV